MANKTTITYKSAAWELSNKLGFTGKYVESLIASANNRGYEGATVKEITKSFDRARKIEQQKAAKKFNLSLKQYQSLQAKAWEILGAFSTGHSMGCYRYLEINKESFQRRHTLHEYANSCKWRETYGSITLKFTKKDLAAIRNIEGIWTIVKSDGSAKWLESTGSKSSYKVVWVEGFVYGSSHSTKSLRDAKVVESRKIQAQIQAMQNDARFIGVDDVVKTGACTAGIKAFCDRHGLNIEMGYNLGWLKSLNDSYGKTYLAKVQK